MGTLGVSVKSGAASSGYTAWRVEITILAEHLRNVHPIVIRRLKDEVYQILPSQEHGGWSDFESGPLYYLRVKGETGHKPDDIYHSLTRTIWEITGHTQIYAEFHEIEVKSGFSLTSEEQDYVA